MFHFSLYEVEGDYMSFLRITVFLLGAAGAVAGQGNANANTAAQLPDHAILPITFTRTVGAAHAKAGDLIEARTSQPIRLSNGLEAPAGTHVTGHVISARAFAYDNTPYAKQVPGTLEIRFDSLDLQGQKIRLHVSLRAMADPVTMSHTFESMEPDYEMDPTLSLIGGDQVRRVEKEIRNSDGDVVGYQKKGGTFAHLIANSSGSLNCDSSDTEQPTARFSASACGLYGFSDVSLAATGRSHVALSSTHISPKIWRDSRALLETTTETASRK
jgi:hypothetical protein